MTVRNRRRSAVRAATEIAVVGAVLVVGAVGATAALRIPSPVSLVKLATRQPSTQGELFASHEIDASPNPRPLSVATKPLPTTVPWAGKNIPIEEFITRTSTNSFLVMRHGELVHEWYREGFEATTRQSSWSVAKSIVSLLVGHAIDRGILSETDRLVDILPELRTGTNYDDITVHNLLDMTSGVDVSENYNPYFPLTGTARMLLTTDLDQFLGDHRELVFQPGSKGEYRSVDTQLLGAVLARKEGRPLSDILRDDLWAPIGAQDAATWNLDRAGGEEKAFCCINATARDFAKIGKLVMDGGMVDGTSVVPAEWITRISTPAPNLVDEWGYSAQWWHPSGGSGQDFSAIGVYGQYIYIDPVTQTVIVKLSDHGAEQDEQQTIDVFRALARS